jgi:hypothetical protein
LIKHVFNFNESIEGENRKDSKEAIKKASAKAEASYSL